MVSAHLYVRDDGWYVAIMLAGEQVDEAGPFFYREDAELAAYRAEDIGEGR